MFRGCDGRILESYYSNVFNLRAKTNGIRNALLDCMHDLIDWQKHVVVQCSEYGCFRMFDNIVDIILRGDHVGIHRVGQTILDFLDRNHEVRIDHLLKVLKRGENCRINSFTQRLRGFWMGSITVASVAC